jgi:hypothetical protein
MDAFENVNLAADASNAALVQELHEALAAQWDGGTLPPLPPPPPASTSTG